MEFVIRYLLQHIPVNTAALPQFPGKLDNLIGKVSHRLDIRLNFFYAAQFKLSAAISVAKGTLIPRTVSGYTN
jgi:hypothetical protein